MPLYSKIANYLKSATTVIDIQSATAPSSGQVLTATGSTTATWQTPGGGGGWTLKSYSTASAASSIQKTSLDLTTDKEYMIIVTGNGTTVKNYTLTMNGITTASYVYGGRYDYYNGTTWATGNGTSAGNAGLLLSDPNNAAKSFFCVIHMRLQLVDGTNTKPVVMWESTSTGNATSNDAITSFRAVGNYTGNMTTMTQIDVTASTGTANWELWIWYPNTA